MPYTYFQFIAYQVPTLEISASGNTLSLAAGLVCDAVPDIPVPAGSGLCDDAFRRLRRFAAVVDQAFRSALVNDHADTLKVFVAPEFYFRPQSGDNYATYDYDQRLKILNILGRMFVNPKFSHWLIVPGTILANTAAPGGPVYFYNTAAVITGGPEGLLSTIEKQQPSNLDGVPIQGGIADPNFKHRMYKDYFQNWSVRKKRVFVTGGIHFSLDICLDHLPPQLVKDKEGRAIRINDDILRQAKKVSREEYRPRIGNPIPLNYTYTELHILTAGGMPIHVQSVAAKIGGYILRSDGSPTKFFRSDGSPIQPVHTELKRVNNYTIVDSNNTPARNTTPFDMTWKVETYDQITEAFGAKATLEEIRSYGTIPLPGKLKIPTAGIDMPQEIVIYPFKRLP